MSPTTGEFIAVIPTSFEPREGVSIYSAKRLIATTPGHTAEDVANAVLLAAAPELYAAAHAALSYDAAIESCANDPDKMASYCTAEGDTLDALYLDWISKARAALAKVSQ